MTKLERLEIKLELTRQRVREENKKKAELKLIAAQKKKEMPRRRTGRPPLKPEIIERARELGETKPLPDVALKLGISLTSLYNHGISRNEINKEKLENKLTDIGNQKNEQSFDD